MGPIWARYGPHEVFATGMLSGPIWAAQMCPVEREKESKEIKINIYLILLDL